MPVVSRLSTTPVKGTALHSPSAVTVTDHGVEDNRRFHLVDARGRLFNGKHHGPLVRIRADYDPETRQLSVAVPGREPVRATTELGDPVVTDFYGRPVAGRLLTGPWAEAISGFVGRPLQLVEPEVPGAAVDVHPVTLVSAATVEHLRSVTPEGGRLDSRRFRMLVELDGCGVHEEDTWAGRRVRIGGTTVRVAGPVPRCVVTNENPDTGVVDFNTLKAVKRYRGELAAQLDTPVAHLPDNGAVIFGMYATVEEPGRIAVDDAVEVLPAEAVALP